MIDIKQDANVYTVYVKEHFTLDDVHELIDQVESHEVSIVLLGVGEVKVFTSSMLGMIISLYKNLAEIDIQFGFFGLSEDNEKLMKISGIDRLIPKFNTAEEGLESFTKDRS